MKTPKLEMHTQRTDAETGRLRRLIASVAGDLAHLPRAPSFTGASTPAGRLAESWAEVVGLLALGRAPDVRECPVCGNVGMRAATRCGHCWTTLVPLPTA